MSNHHSHNERIKRRYFAYLKEAKRQSEATIDEVAKALSRFENDTGHRDFKAFHVEQAIAFKRHLAEQVSLCSGRTLSKATLHGTLAHLKRFFHWLAGQPGYRSRLRYSDCEYFNLSEKETRVAMARREKAFPTLEQVAHVIAAMRGRTEVEQRNRALLAFAILTGARDSAIASMKLKHLDLGDGKVDQDAREVNTKFSKSSFFPVGEGILQILMDWVNYLRYVKLWGNDDPLFPATDVGVGDDRQFEAVGIKRAHWRTAAPIRSIFREAFNQAGLPYFNPHSFRNTLAQLGEQRCQTPEEFKAWSQNLGQEEVMTTFRSYGAVGSRRQGDIIRSLTGSTEAEEQVAAEIVRDVLNKLRRARVPA